MWVGTHSLCAFALATLEGQGTAPHDGAGIA